LAADQPHLAALAPPIVNFSRASNPHLALGAQLSEVSQQLFVCIEPTAFENVVWMNDKVSQPVFFTNQRNLAFPEVDGVLIKNMKEAVVLCCGDGQFQHLADEKGRDRAA